MLSENNFGTFMCELYYSKGRWVEFIEPLRLGGWPGVVSRSQTVGPDRVMESSGIEVSIEVNTQPSYIIYTRGYNCIITFIVYNSYRSSRYIEDDGRRYY